MSSSTTNRVTEKIFVGFELPVDIKMQLNKNSEWKQAEIEHAESEEHLKIIRFNDAEYIGRYTDEQLLTIKQIQKLATAVKEELEAYVAEVKFDELKVALFPQVFVS